jgi:hypothetical protein
MVLSAQSPSLNFVHKMSWEGGEAKSVISSYEKKYKTATRRKK